MIQRTKQRLCEGFYPMLLFLVLSAAQAGDVVNEYGGGYYDGGYRDGGYYYGSYYPSGTGSNGGYYRGTTNTNSHRNHTSAAISIGFWVILYFLAYRCCYVPFLIDAPWNLAIKSAEAEVINDTTECYGQQPWCFVRKFNFGDSYYTSAVPRNKPHGPHYSMGKICFEVNRPRNETDALCLSACQNISGKGNDDFAGHFRIIQGLVSLSSGKCYWIQEPSTHPWDQTLIVGSILEASPSSPHPCFKGRWHRRNGDCGKHLTIELIPSGSNEDSSPKAPALAMPTGTAVPAEDGDCESTIQIPARPVEASTEALVISSSTATRPRHTRSWRELANL